MGESGFFPMACKKSGHVKLGNYGKLGKWNARDLGHVFPWFSDVFQEWWGEWASSWWDFFSAHKKTSQQAKLDEKKLMSFWWFQNVSKTPEKTETDVDGGFKMFQKTRNSRKSFHHCPFLDDETRSMCSWWPVGAGTLCAEGGAPFHGEFSPWEKNEDSVSFQVFKSGPWKCLQKI